MDRTLPSSLSVRPPRAAWFTALTAALVVVAAAAWLQYADHLAGPLAPEGPERFATDRIGPQIELLRRPGFLIGAVCVAFACWISTRGYATGVRARTTTAAGGAAFVLYFTQAQWIEHYNSFQPYDTANATLSWALSFIAPTTGLLTGTAAWTALGSGAPRIPFRSRLVLTAAATSAGLLALAVYLLRQVQYQWGNIDTVYWVAMSTGAPAVGVLTGLLTHVTADRSLRPVEAIRQRLAHITSHSLDQRVPVPSTDDAIARLARTTNDTLDRLEQASIRQRQFVGDAAHELRSPLAAVRAQLESALQHPEGIDWPSVVRESVADVIRLQALANDLLLLAQMDGSPHTTPAAEEVDLSSLAEDLIRELQHLPDAQGLELTCDAPPSALVRGNTMQIERLLRNLLGNACRHARHQVTIRFWLEADTVVTEVTDDGPGIPPADRERVFERFTRLDEARSRSDGGAGLGLPIAREIASRHGGTLVVANSDRGARVVSRLPLSTRRPAAADGV
ncbi:sensor histidine kinase [Streptomyces exfoliatus]|uniref:sensor histidine kinase n=1 Tax=Streptomyces exfoliatus TaxID=1905 RepID=UPI0004649913|nr:HAMP domain-containing sensor histidine kinase [Streptomyces exfoliatus]